MLDCVGSCPTNYTVCLEGVEIACFLLNVHVVEQLSGMFGWFATVHVEFLLRPS